MKTDIFRSVFGSVITIIQPKTELNEYVDKTELNENGAKQKRVSVMGTPKRRNLNTVTITGLGSLVVEKRQSDTFLRTIANTCCMISVFT